jgi:HD-GYP domain-containing protein (c-di-GMP phosphodiesterase class II)
LLNAQRDNIPGTAEAEATGYAEPMHPIELICLQDDSSVPCDLYKKVNDSDFVLFARQGMDFKSVVRKTLLENKTSTLYVDSENIGNYYDFLTRELSSVVVDPKISPQQKAEAVHQSCHLVMEKTFSDPRAFFIKSALNVISPTVKMIVEDHVASRHLINLTAYDHCTYIHSTNVGIFCIALARIFFKSGEKHDMNRLATGFFLHDLGKCRIPLSIINKPGKLTDAERQVVNQHPEEGYKILEESGVSTEEARIIVLQHHERDDGNGYPFGLTGKDIHPYARICRLADIYEALTSKRPYHNRHTTFEALKVIQAQMADVDRELLRCFLNLFVQS